MPYEICAKLYPEEFMLQDFCRKFSKIIDHIVISSNHLIMFYFHTYVNYIIQLKLFAPFIIAFNESNQDVKG